MLTTSEDEEEILRRYQLQANFYVTKPVGLEQFLAVVRQIDSFRLEVVKPAGTNEMRGGSPWNRESSAL